MKLTIKNLAEAILIATEQNWQEESTTYWFELNGTDYGTEYEFSGETYGVVESGGDQVIVNSDNYPLTEGDAETIAVRNTVTVTDEIRKEAAGQ